MHVSSDNSDDDDDKTVPSEGDEGDNLDLEIASESSRKDEERICDPEWSSMLSLDLGKQKPNPL